MLKDIIRTEFTQARKNNDTIKKNALEAIIAGILMKEKSGKGEITDNDVLECITKEIKVQNEIVELYKTKVPAKSEEAAEKVKVLSGFLPKQLTEEEALEIIKENDIYDDASPKTKGMIIKAVMPLFAGKFDKSKVNPLVEKYLASK